MPVKLAITPSSSPASMTPSPFQSTGSPSSRRISPLSSRASRLSGVSTSQMAHQSWFSLK
jgi:hypothetical protein